MDSEENFEDALEEQEAKSLSTSDLEPLITEAHLAVHLFFNNKFEEAKKLMEPRASTSIYHALGDAVFKFLEAMLTFEQSHIETASNALKSCILLCTQYRKKLSFTQSLKISKRSSYDLYTPVEIHAEMCFAEANLLKSILTFIEDETLISFIKAGMNIRTCYYSYKECSDILQARNWSENEKLHKTHFESGVRMGVGTFNLMISLLPPKAIKLLEFIGFSGNRQRGLEHLMIGYQLKNSIRQILSVMTLLGYHLIVMHVLSEYLGDLKLCDEIISSQLALYPDGVWFLFFKGRLDFIKADFESSIHWYLRSWKSQETWPQFHHICFWELMWVNAAKGEWREAAAYADLLIEQSKWSPTIYRYQKAALLLMIDYQEITEEEEAEIESLMRDLPQYKQKIAGKSIPMEKFSIRRAARYFAQKKSLTFPAYELLYLWNIFKIIGQKLNLIETIYKNLEHKLRQLEHIPGEKENLLLVTFLKGVCLTHMNSPLQAQKCFLKVIGMEKDLVEEKYLVPYAYYELALISRRENDMKLVRSLIEAAKKYPSSYSLESRLQFRIQTFDLECLDKSGNASQSTSS